VRAAKEGWSAKSGAATSAPTGEGEMDATGGTALLLQAARTTTASKMGAVRPHPALRATFPARGEVTNLI
jgi:hypothetical protein